MNFNKNYTKTKAAWPPIAVWIGLLLCLLLQTGRLNAQCSPDITPPTATCTNSVVISVPAGTCSGTVTVPEPVVTDNCPGQVTLTSDIPPGNVFPAGQTAVTFTATDASGNTKTCSVTVYVNGGIVPPTCIDQDTVFADPSGVTIYNPADLLEGGPYNCSQIMGSLSFNGTPTPTVSITGLGNPFVYVSVTNGSGGYNKCWGHVRVLNDPCASDVTPPVAVCDEAIVIQSNVMAPGVAIVTGALLNNASYDECTPVEELVFRADTAFTGTPATTASISLGVGDYNVYMWVGDKAGNWNACAVQVSVIPPKCSPDNTKPYCTAPPNQTISGNVYAALNIDPQNTAQMNAAFGAPYYWDNCDNGNAVLQESAILETYPGGNPKKITRSFIVYDAANNASPVVQQIITISLPLEVLHVPGWHYPGDPAVDTMSYTFTTVLSAYSDQIFLAPCNGEKSKTHRTWSVLDWSVTPGPEAVLPALDVNNDGLTGDAYDVVVFNDSLWRMENGLPVQFIAHATGLYSYLQIIRENYLDTATYHITGTVFRDQTSNCVYDAGEPLLEGWKVKGIGQNSNRSYTAYTDANGVYDLTVCTDDALVEVSLDVPYNYAGECNSTYNTAVGAVVPVVNLPVYLTDTCSILAVDIATDHLRPCFNSVYSVNYCNFSPDSIQNTYIEVALDPYLEYISSTIPGIFQGTTYRFNTGTLQPGACDMFQIVVKTNCNTPVGLTHCTEASIYPTDRCGYSGPELYAFGFCDVDSIRMKITNVGLGDMTESANFVVAEDLIMYMTAPLQLNSGQIFKVAFPANTSTWRIEVPQPSGFPFGGMTVATVEGCQTPGIPGIVNVYSNSDPDPFTSTDCTQNTSSYDPNDKLAFPTGYGNEHFIRENTDIEYMIRFQNTGTDTAFNVVVIDTLSPFLDIRSVRPGASSHMYDFDIVDGHALRFIFDNILLPDSNANEAASHGFVKFRVSQAPDIQLGAVINNNASIHFDFNAPVITNTTWHTIGKDFMEVNAVNPGAIYGKMLLYPNPASGSLYLEMPAYNNDALLELVNSVGQTVTSRRFSGKTYRLDQPGLTAGVYTFKVTANDGAVYTGKVVFK